MTIETQGSTTVDDQALDSVNESSSNEKSIITRLIIGKILSSGILPYLEKKENKSLTDQFLAAEPDLNFTMTLSDLPEICSTYYYKTIASVKFLWDESQTEIVDGTGNAWVTYKFVCIPSIFSMSTHGTAVTALDIFMQRARCIDAMCELLDELTEMVSQPIRIIKLNNDERLARDKQHAYETTVSSLISKMSKNGECHKARLNLRAGGSDRIIDLSKFGFIAAPAPGCYYFTLNDGSARRKDLKHFSVTVRSNGYDYNPNPLKASIRRVRNLPAISPASR